MNKYELALVVNAKIDDEARAAVVEKAKDYIARYNGTVTEVEEWGKKRLAYEIQKMREGYYYFIQFESDAACPAEVEGRIRIMDNVLRYLVVKKEAQFFRQHKQTLKFRFIKCTESRFTGFGLRENRQLFIKYNEVIR